MKIIRYIVLILLTFLLNDQLKAQSFEVSPMKTAMTTDSLTWYRYIPGRPDMRRLEANKAVAAKWGFRMEYLFGDCTGGLDKEGAAHEAQNEALFEFLAAEHGEGWREKFESEVALELEKDRH